MSEGGCTSKEPYALQVLGTSMEPEFIDGTVIIIDPGYPPCDGAFVVIDYQNETMLRQIVMHDGRKFLRPVKPHDGSTGPLNFARRVLATKDTMAFPIRFLGVEHGH